MRLNNSDLLMVTKIEGGSPPKVLMVLMALRIGSTCGPCSGGDYGSVIAHLHVRQMYIKFERFTIMELLTAFETTKKCIVFYFSNLLGKNIKRENDQTIFVLVHCCTFPVLVCISGNLWWSGATIRKRIKPNRALLYGEKWMVSRSNRPSKNCNRKRDTFESNDFK